MSKMRCRTFGPAHRRPCRIVLHELEDARSASHGQGLRRGRGVSDAVAACEKAPSTTPFKWNGGKQTAVVGLNSVRPDKYTVIASYTLVADSVYCDYDPIRKKADIGSNFLERE
ncbi:hypothetical protein SAMN05444171_8006 [Bradyrhizobium lablabi]|uniref:Uncharacterized protein n=2 Tax=Bradyrhizobium TaxID=374 RepID=A0ABY0QF14_9BRAD|nr:hypothetical protein SAMN05444163_7268 [Bradyrhizobium ottawaense]SEE77888.1 hypothetical protein SAMN05444171_8006 [Bradyrhizobium lablabi]